MREFVRDRVNPLLLRYLKVGVAPYSRWLAGQRSFLMDDLGIRTVLDVGANTGQYGLRMRRSGFPGDIHSFEPGAEALAGLHAVAAADPRWHVHAVALGARTGRATFHSWTGPASEAASLRVPSSGMVGMLGAPRTETVDVRTLDAWLDANDVEPGRTWLKIDVQGSEREVLEGAGERLREFPALEMEAALGELYEGEASLGELLAVMADAGFLPCSIVTERFHTGWRGAADVDVLFLRSDLSRLPTGSA